MQGINEFLLNKQINKITETQWKEILKGIKNEIKDNKSTIYSMNNIDKNHYKKQVSIEDLIKEIEKYEKEQFESSETKSFMYSYYGNPILTMNLLLKSIKYNIKAIFAIEDYMLAINSVLITIVNNVLQDNKIGEMFNIQNLLEVQEVKKYSNKLDKILCIGNSFNYFLYTKNKIKNVEYEPFNAIDVYCDSEELEELQLKIYEFCQEEFIEIQIYDCENIDEAIRLFNHSVAAQGVLLTKTKEHIKKAKEEVKKVKMVINKNPFENQNFMILDKYLK